MVNVDPAQRAVDFTEKVIESMYPDVVTDTDNANVRIWMGFGWDLMARLAVAVSSWR